MNTNTIEDTRCDILTEAARRLGWHGVVFDVNNVMHPYKSWNSGESIENFFKDLIESKYIRNESYFIYSSSRKKSNITSSSFAKYCLESEGAGSFIAMCFFPDLKDITIACKSTAFPDQLWENDYSTLKQDEDYIYEYKCGGFGTSAKNIFNKEGSGVRFIRHAKFINWYHNEGGKALCDSKNESLLKEKAPFRHKFQAIIEEAKITLSRYQKKKLNNKAIFYIDPETKDVGWSFDKQEVNVGDLVTLADGVTQTRVLYFINA
jgi:hypothetical protein